MSTSLSVNDHCAGLGVCTAMAPDLFEIKDGYSRALVPELADDATVELAREAAESCPMTAIEVGGA